MMSVASASRLLRCCRLMNRDRRWWKSIEEKAINYDKNSAVFSGAQCHFGTETIESNRDNRGEDFARNYAGVDENIDVQDDKAGIDARTYLLVKQLLETKVKECATVDAVLCQIVDVKLQPIHVHIVLERLSQIVTADKDSTQPLHDMTETFQTQLFGRLEYTLNRDITRVTPTILLNCLQSLLSLTPADIPLVQSLETQVMWLMRRFTIGQMVRVLEIHANHQETELRQQMYSTALTSIEKRWVEITNPKDLITLLYITLNNSRKLSDKLEDKALELAEEMSAKELYRVVYLLAKKRHRNTPLLRALTYHLNKSKLNLSTVQISNLLYACSTLNICDGNLLEKISTSLRQKINQGGSISSSLQASMLYSLSSLRWQNQLTMDALVESLQHNQQNVSQKDMANIICSVAKLNYMSPQLADILPEFREKLLTGGDFQAGVWLDVVWSLAVLKLLTPVLAGSVLNPEFFIKLAGGDAFKALTRHIKLLNIQAAAEYELENYDGPKLPPFADNSMAKPLLRGERNLAASVMSVLNSMAPSDQYMKTAVVTQSGYYLDADLFVNLSGKPLVYADFCDKQTAGVKRLAVRVLDFTDLTLDTKLPTGLHVMASRHLTAEGYTVIQIPYTEFDERGKTVQKVQYLQNKINVAIGKVAETS